MTTSSQSAAEPPQSDDFGARTIVAAGGALGMVVLALIVYAITDMVLPTLIIVLLIPIHVALAITDTNLLEDPKTAPFRAWGDLQKLVGSATAKTAAPKPGAWTPPPAPTPPSAPAPAPAPAHWSGPAGPASPTGAVPPTNPAPPTNLATPADPAPPTWNTPQPVGPRGQQPPPPAPTSPSVAPARPISLGPGLSFDPPGPRGPSVIYGFGSYGGRATAPNPHEAPQPAPEASPQPTPQAVPQPPEVTASQKPRPEPEYEEMAYEESMTLAKPATEDYSPLEEPASPDAPFAPTPDTAPVSGLPQWDDIDGDHFDDDPDLTIQRPPRT